MKISKFLFNRLPIIAKINIVSQLSLTDFDQLSQFPELDYLFHDYPYSEQVYEEFCRRYYHDSIKHKDTPTQIMKWREFYIRIYDVNIPKWTNIPIDKSVEYANVCASKGQLMELKIMYEWKKYFFPILPNIHGIDLAACHGHLETLIWIYSKNPILRQRTANLAYKFAHVHVLNWLTTHNLFPKVDIPETIKKGQVRLLFWLFEQDYEINQNMINEATRNLIQLKKLNNN